MLSKENASPKEQVGGGSLSGMLLVAGTCIGAGMLALPIVTGISGFYPAMFVSTLCWLFMLCTGLLFLEVTLWMEDGANVLSMAQRFLGPVGKWVGGLSFLFLYYCLQVSYLSGGVPLMNSLVTKMTGLTASPFSSYLLFTLLFGVIVFLGARLVDRVNWVLMIGLVVTFVLLILVGSTEVQASFLKRSNWGLCLLAAPILFSAYGYHNVIPSIATYLKRNVLKLRLSIIFGTAIPFIAYSLWQWMIIGSLTEAQLMRADREGVPISQALQEITGHPWVTALGVYFGLFALVTSLLGVSLSMVDFLADGLKMKREGLSRVALCLAVFVPPALFAAQNPGIFIEAIGIAGGYGEAILNGLLPIAMVWVGRYRMGLESKHQLPGGRFSLIVLLLFTLLIMALETFQLFG